MIKDKHNEWQASLSLSIILHVILIAIFLFGTPFLLKIPKQNNDVLTFEILPLSNIVNVHNKTQIVQKEKKAKKSRQIKKVQQRTPPSSQKKITDKPTTEKARTELTTLPKKNINKIKAKPEEKPKSKPKPKEKPKPKSKETLKEKPKKKTEKKSKANSKKNARNAELKNLEKDSDGKDAKSKQKSYSKKKADEEDSWGDYDDEHPLSITEQVWIKNQIKKHWNIQATSQNMGKIIVTLHITVSQNGTINNVVIKDIICPKILNETCELVKTSAIRAVMKASPLKNLQPERYYIWKEFDLEFAPLSGE